MSLPSINKLIEQFNITMFNTDMKSYFFPISERLGLSKNVFTYHATVKEIKLERDDVINITLQPSKNWKGFISGQFIDIMYKIGSIFYTRTFSISSSLKEFKQDGTIQLSIQIQKNGKVTPQLLDGLKVDDIIGITEAKGDFILQANQEKLLFIAGGTGITPFRAMLYQCIDENRDVDIIYSCKKGKHLFADELKRLNTSNIRVHFLTSDVDGRLNAEILKNKILDIEIRPIYICGPSAMIKDTIACIQEHQLSNQEIYHEYFHATDVSNFVPTEKIDSKIELNKKRIEINCDNQSTILETLEKNSIKPKHGCRMGLCKECTCTKLSGKVYNKLTQKISDNNTEDIQICISIPIGDVKINL